MFILKTASSSKEHEAREKFENVIESISDWSKELAADHVLLLTLQFGSSARRPLKLKSDIDLFMVFNEPGSDDQIRRIPLEKQIEIISSLEDHTTPLLGDLRKAGFDYSLSPLIRSERSLSRYNAFYLDLPECSRVLFDANNYWVRLCNRILAFCEKYGACKVNSGKQVVWDLSSTLKPGEVFDPVF